MAGFIALMYLGGVPLANNVTGVAIIDLDVRNIRLAIDEQAAPNLTSAYEAYTHGTGLAMETPNGQLELLNLRGLSTNEDFTGEFYFDTCSKYFGSKTYADDFISAAFSGTGQYAGKSLTQRAEGVYNGVLTLTLWMRVVTEFQEGITNCVQGTSSRKSLGVLRWVPADK